MPQLIISGNVMGLPDQPPQQQFPSYIVIRYDNPIFYTIAFTQPFINPPAVSLQYLNGDSNDHTVEEVFIELKSVDINQIFVQLNQAGRIINGNFSFIAVGDVLTQPDER